MKLKQMACRVEIMEGVVAEVQRKRHELKEKLSQYIFFEALRMVFTTHEELLEYSNRCRRAPRGTVLRDVLTPHQLEQLVPAYKAQLQKYTGMPVESLGRLTAEQRMGLLLKSEEIRNVIQPPNTFQTRLHKKIYGNPLAQRNQW